MLKKVQIDTAQPDIAVKVSKTFTQWQRENAGKGLIKNLLKPEKKIITALDDVSFTIKKGEFVAYAGPNGDGKSTTMKLLYGMLLPNSGEISVLSMSPQKQRMSLMSKTGILFGNRTELWWNQRILMVSNGKIAFYGSFEGLRNITGCLSRVSITMADHRIPTIEGAHLLSSKNCVFDFEIDLNKLPIKHLLFQISQLEQVKDVEIKKAPIEQVISELYTAWK
jgi:ABC-type uncharacterized transport system ATPase subunit